LIATRFLDDEVRDRLRYVRVPRGQVDLTRFPGFLIVGPQRTGTTWIHANLRDHPDILWPRDKEVFFFSRLKDPAHPKFRSADLNWYLTLFRDPLWMRLVKTGLSYQHSRSLYDPKICGEATASYAAMDPDLIDEVVALNPDMRVVLMIRDPVERAWSHAKKDLVRNANRKYEDVSDEEFRAFFADPYQRRCAQYAENYDNWKARLRDGNLWIGKFDDITTRPAEMLSELCVFLGVRSGSRYLGGSVHRAVNPTAASSVPPQHREFLEQLLAEDLEKLAERLDLSWS
jgi:hypothetical protein